MQPARIAYCRNVISCKLYAQMPCEVLEPTVVNPANEAQTGRSRASRRVFPRKAPCSCLLCSESPQLCPFFLMICDLNDTSSAIQNMGIPVASAQESSVDLMAEVRLH